MINPNNCSLVFLLLGVLAFNCVLADEDKTLEITTQGFSAAQPQDGVVGSFPRLRIRIEASDRIKTLNIKERSYVVDLAATKDKQNLRLFGLHQTPRSYPDVTLNLQNYINERIKKAGEYELHILVTDKKDKTAEKKIFINVDDARPEAESDEGAGLLHTGSFQLKRSGAGPVDGSQKFGIDWKTIENANVIIRITKAKDANTQLAMLDKSVFDAIQTIDQLTEVLAGAKKVEAVSLTTASNKSAGEVFSIIHNQDLYLLKVMKSSTLQSNDGTIVTLEGYYKYHNAEK